MREATKELPPRPPCLPESCFGHGPIQPVINGVFWCSKSLRHDLRFRSAYITGLAPALLVGFSRIVREARLLFWQIHAIRHGFTHQDMHLTAQKRAVEYDPLVGLKNGSGERRSCESRLMG